MFVLFKIYINFVPYKMKAKTLHIETPSEELLKFFRNLRAEKEEYKAKLIAKKDSIFPKSK